MIHLHGCWLNNGSLRSSRRAERARLEDAQRRINASLVTSSKLWPMFMEMSKREARLLQSQHFKQTGETA